MKSLPRTFKYLHILLIRAEEPESAVFGLLEPLEKKTGAGARAAPKKSEAGAAKNMRLLEDEKHKEVVHL